MQWLAVFSAKQCRVASSSLHGLQVNESAQLIHRSQVAVGSIPPQLTPMAPNLGIRSRAEGDFASGQAAVAPQNRFIAPPLQTVQAADASGTGGR